VINSCFAMDLLIREKRAAPPGRCHNCQAENTPEWRRGPDGARTLCNACGLRKAPSHCDEADFRLGKAFQERTGSSKTTGWEWISRGWHGISTIAIRAKKSIFVTRCPNSRILISSRPFRSVQFCPFVCLHFLRLFDPPIFFFPLILLGLSFQ